MKPRPQKPFTELQRLSAGELAQLWSDLHTGLSYTRAVHILAKEHFIYIRRHRLFRWWHLESNRRQLNAHLPGEFQLTAAQFFDLLNAQSLPWADLMHTRILQAGYILSCDADQTPSRLLTLQRIANNPFRQQLAREKLALATRAQNLREQQTAAKTPEIDTGPDSELALQQKINEFLGPPIRQLHTNPPTAPHTGLHTDPLSAPGESTPTSEPAPVPASRCADPQRPMENTRCSTLKELPPSRPLAVAQPSAPNLTDRVDTYTLARHREALDHRHASHRHQSTALYKTDLRYCPCGEKVLPCPHHGDYPGLFWQITPDHADYIQILQSKKLPYTAPHLLLCEQENATQRAAAEKALALQYPDPAARQAFLHERARSHALRRWRSHTPRPAGSPSPDETWIDECPCGAPAPCHLHPGLWHELRYVKPSQPEYAAALKREHIPVYPPAPDATTTPPSSEMLNAEKTPQQIEFRLPAHHQVLKYSSGGK